MPRFNSSVENPDCIPRSIAAPVELNGDDCHLVDAARHGDAIAYGRLVNKYYNRLCGALRRFCGSLADAQDAAQEAFLRAYVKLSSFSRTCGFYTWLYRIGVNVTISNRRQRQARSLGGRIFATAATEAIDQAERPDERLVRQQRAEQVRQALASLSGEFQTILVLREIEDRGYGEIASILNVPVGTVRSRLHRARLQLREKLAPITR